MSEITKATVLDAPVKPVRGNWLVTFFNTLIEYAAMVLMASLAMLVFINAAGRYLFSTPLPWTEELVISLLVWLAALGIVMAGMRQALICCDIVTERLSIRKQRVLTTFSALAGSGVMLYCAWLTWEYMTIFGGDLSPIMRLPKSIVIGAVFFALLGLAATLLVPLFRKR
ncbi:TRAP transporter small permease [Pseudochelatococcus sp. B33]